MLEADSKSKQEPLHSDRANGLWVEKREEIDI
jgi:hypothetical protein